MGRGLPEDRDTKRMVTLSRDMRDIYTRGVEDAL